MAAIKARSGRLDVLFAMPASRASGRSGSVTEAGLGTPSWMPT